MLEDAIWTGLQFIAIGRAGTVVTSPDGVGWTLRTTNISVNLNGATSSASMVVAVGDNGAIITSGDGGVTWAVRNSGTTYTLKKVAWTGSEFVAVGSGGMVLRSTDGITWTIPASPYYNITYGSNNLNLNDVIWTGTGGRLVAVGTNGLIATSP
jgi:photosystem II stability/assembly factor-like uncharacterized protein